MSNPTTNLGMTLPVSEQDAQKVATYNAAFQVIDSMVGAWASWTPTWTNLTLGNGTVTAKYGRIGKFVFCRLHVVLGSTSSVSSNAAGVSFSLPVTQATYGGTATLTPLGPCRLYDSSGTAASEGQLVNASTTTALIAAFDASATYLKSAVVKDTVPFTWATSDEINAQFMFEGA